MMRQQSIWIDLDNAPHVHFFAPIVRELHLHGLTPLITARSFGQTEDLARSYSMRFETIGEHRALSSRAARISGTLHRAAQLVRFGMTHRPVAAVSHGSRALTIAAASLGIPVLALYDYEHISTSVFDRCCRRILVPEVVAQGSTNPKVHGYPGFKENVYIHHITPDPAVLTQLELDAMRAIITVRPPATWAHYHFDHSTTLFRALIERLRLDGGAQVVVLARTASQRDQLVRDFDLNTSPFRVTAQAVDGLSLLHYSDAVFSGGGTMVREAALLGIPAYSTFAGASGAVDRELERLGRLTVLRHIDEIAALQFSKRLSSPAPAATTQTRAFIVQQILELASQGPLS